MRILFTSAQIPGHLDWGGYLLTAVELAARGHEVLWASGESVAEIVGRAAIPFYALPDTGWRWPPPPPLPKPRPAEQQAWQRSRALRALDQWLDTARVAVAAADLRAVAASFQPDLMVTEMFVAAAGIVAEQIGKPLVVAGWPARPLRAGTNDELVQLARERLNELLQQFSISGKYWTAQGPPALWSPALHLTYWSDRWYTGVELAGQTRHVGGQSKPHASPDPRLPMPGDEPWVLITLGTSFNEDPNFFVAAAHAVKQVGALPIVVLGGTSTPAAGSSWLAQLPAGTKVLDHVDFRTVLPYTAAAIHHGGAGTTHAMVTHAIPQIVVPHAADQVHQAYGVVRSGVGLHIAAQQASVATLTQGLAELLPDLSRYREQAVLLQAEFSALGGAPKAATLLEEVHRP